MATVCKLRKFGHCKFGKFCNFVHVDEHCEVKDCDSRGCNQRHPKDCRYILKYGRCKFSEFCSYNHNIENVRVLSQSSSDNLERDLGKKVSELEKNMEAMQKEIVLLTEKLKVLETKELSSDEESENESSDFESGDANLFPEDSPLSDTDLGNEDEAKDIFKCDLCDFNTAKQSGLAIHIGVKHKQEEHVPRSIDNDHYDYYSLQKCGKCFKLVSIQTSKCLGFIHNSSCWSFYSPCSNLPDEPPDNELPVKDDEGRLHVAECLVLEQGHVNWEELYGMIVGYCLEN